MSDLCKYGFNYFTIQDPENSLQIRPYQTELENSRMEDLKSLMNSVQEIRRDFENVKTQVSNFGGNQNMDYLKKQLFILEENISLLKDDVRKELLTLLRDEVTFTKDIQFMEKRIGEWGKPIDLRVLKPIKPSKYKVKTDNQNPTEEFQKFLSRSGGHCGGWEEQDHLLFLKERTKHKRKEKFLSAVQYLLPDVSYEEIENHEVWYQKYESLKNAQKEAIQKWKLEKKTQEEKKEKEKEERKENKKEVKSFRRQINIAERIKEWKNQQKLRQLVEEERLKKEKEKLKEEEKRKKELQEFKKLAVSQYKAEKQNKTQAFFSSGVNAIQKQQAKAKNKILLKAFRLQDLKYIEKKRVIRLQIESKASDKFERLKLEKPALEFILQRNPQRIFQPTFIWSQHCLETQEKEKTIPVFDLNSIPRLAIPEWRRELK